LRLYNSFKTIIQQLQLLVDSTVAKCASRYQGSGANAK
jgi:hypothetical protein